jgi:hypothetical protein
MAYSFTNTAATTAAVNNRFVTTANMSLTPYTIANASPVWSGGCLVTITHTVVAGSDTLGTITIVGTDLTGATISEVITPISGTVATSTKIFRTVVSATSLGWAAVSTADTITIGCAAGNIALGSQGVLQGVLVNNTVGTAFSVLSGSRTILTVPASQAAGTFYNFGAGIDVGPFLSVSTTSTNDVTVIHTSTQPSSQA